MLVLIFLVSNAQITRRATIVQADEKVSTGKSGSVLYWRVSDFEETLAHFLSLGAKLYRGPLNIESGMVMCQVEDPFGNLIGLRGMS